MISVSYNDRKCGVLYNSCSFHAVFEAIRSLPGLSVGKGLKGRILGILGVGGELRPQEALLLAGLHSVLTGKSPEELQRGFRNSKKKRRSSQI